MKMVRLNHHYDCVVDFGQCIIILWLGHLENGTTVKQKKIYEDLLDYGDMCVWF